MSNNKIFTNAIFNQPRRIFGIFRIPTSIAFDVKNNTLTGINIVPEIVGPGHAYAAIHAMEKRFEKTQEDTYRLTDPLAEPSGEASVQGTDFLPCLATKIRQLFFSKFSWDPESLFSIPGLPR